MKKTGLVPFVSGVLSTALIFGLATTALAASGTISLNTVNLNLNRKAVFAQGEELTNDAGRTIPSSITYTDGAGGDTTYLPLAYVARLLDTQIAWDQATQTVKLGYGAVGEGSGSGSGGGSLTEGGNSGLTNLPFNAIGSVASPFTEIAPIQPQDGESFSYAIAPTDYMSQEGYENAVPLSLGNGKYCSITVTNRNDFPLLFTLGRQYNQSAEKIYTQIPAGQTVTRTVEIGQQAGTVTSPKLLVAVGSYQTTEELHISIEGIQFGL